MTLMVPSLHSLPSDKISSISSAPALPPNPPLSPDVSPLLPSPGGVVHPPTGSSLPTIPSDSTQNPDLTNPVGPDTAFAPSGLLQASSTESRFLVTGLKLGTFVGFLAHCTSLQDPFITWNRISWLHHRGYTVFLDRVEISSERVY
ncbi:classical arabinogalactan protein 26-like [Olea europaea var. sylvestris]|uniref:classical arabinogalactan protein 26-like n=1 Tax=Olea europaea var. sylvestris TaxID=158386 RepID=UPI000C1D8070|nr:classical arabinogalactan protein 26-like [Olea europaea var. sylvestris]